MWLNARHERTPLKDAQGRKILIEIQNYFQRDFFQRMLYGASKLVTEHLGIGESYGGIGKVYSVNIVYFLLGEARGEAKAKFAMARALAADGMPHDKIAAHTGLSRAEVTAVLKNATAPE